MVILTIMSQSSLQSGLTYTVPTDLIAGALETITVSNSITPKVLANAEHILSAFSPLEFRGVELQELNLVTLLNLISTQPCKNTKN